MSVTTEKTVRDLAVEHPSATRVFERLRIDYCCGGDQTLEQACLAAGVSIDRVVAELEAGDGAPAETRDWNCESLADLIDHIRGTHHVYTRNAIRELPQLIDKVCAAHGKNHPELLRIRPVFAALAQELSMHLMKEEMVLFPYIVQLEEARLAGEPPLPAPFGTVRNPVAMMENEHDSAGGALRDLRAITSDYALPADACMSYRTLFGALAEFEADLHQHIHLENNILHPRAVALER
jgi:regulator of cell morphogenesis and NO signaling